MYSVSVGGARAARLGNVVTTGVPYAFRVGLCGVALAGRRSFCALLGGTTHKNLFVRVRSVRATASTTHLPFSVVLDFSDVRDRIGFVRCLCSERCARPKHRLICLISRSGTFSSTLPVFERLDAELQHTQWDATGE